MDFKCLKDCINISFLFKPMNILKIKDIYELEMDKFIYSYYQYKLSENFDHALVFSVLPYCGHSAVLLSP